MRPLSLFCFLLMLLCTSLAPAAAQTAMPAAGGFIALCYHDIVVDVREDRDPESVDAAQLVEQFSWLRDHGYVPVSLSDIVASREGGKPLPDKAVLLTFDDGYRSLYTQAFPLLKLFHYPAVAAIVGSWMETAPGGEVDYGGHPMPRANFISWQELKEMTDSGLVEVASHTYDLHRGIEANPQGNLQPAATTRRYDAGSGRYESDTEFLDRVRADLQRNSQLIEKHLGRAPRAMVWPYGAYSLETNKLAAAAGMPIALNLQDGPNPPGQPLDRIKRTLLVYTSTITDFAAWVQPPPRPDLQRIAHVDLDYVYDADPARQEENLGHLLDRIKAMGVDTVYLQAFADPDGNGAADALYFPNRHLPMRADLFNRAAWQLRTRAGVKVYAWMPVLAFELPAGHAPVARTVTVPGAEPGYPRLSLFDPAARRVIREIYEDLAKNAPVAGILFHDDATLSDYEDASDTARAVYANDWGLPGTLAALRADPAALRQWTQRKTHALTAFTLELADVVRRYQPDIKTARNLYANVVMNPESEAWFAQSATDFFAAYDYTAVMAMPFMEQADDPTRWMETLYDRIAHIPGAIDKTVFELQSRDWRHDKPVSTALLAEQIRLLRLRGARSVAYYPDDFLNDQPVFNVVQPAISKSSQME